MLNQRGAKWLAQEQREIGAADGNQAPVRSGNNQTVTESPQLHRWPITELMSERAFREFAEMVAEFDVH